MHTYNFSEENISKTRIIKLHHCGEKTTLVKAAFTIELLIVHDWCIVLLIDYLVMHTFSKIQF